MFVSMYLLSNILSIKILKIKMNNQQKTFSLFSERQETLTLEYFS